MTDVTQITVPLPHSAADVATLQREAELTAAFPDFDIADAGEYAAVDAALSDVVRRKDAVIAMRKSATSPLYGVVKTVESWFRPVVVALESAETRLKGTMNAYLVAQHAREREARAAIATASEGVELVAALAVATEAGAPPAGRATVAFVWIVDRVIVDLLPDEWWTPDTAKIAAVAKAHKGDDPPVIPGVVFKRDAKIGARR